MPSAASSKAASNSLDSKALSLPSSSMVREVPFFLEVMLSAMVLSSLCIIFFV